MKKAIVTGASGFVGANLVQRLIDEGHEVYALIRPQSQPWRLNKFKEKCQIHQIDLQNHSGIESLILTIRPEWIFHLAVNGAYSWQTDIWEMFNANILGTINLVESCLKTGFEAFINTGSSSEYGFKKHPAQEEERLDPNSYYAVTKASATMYCQYIAKSRQVNLTTLRLYSVYGPFEDARRLIPTLITLGLEGKLPPLVDPYIARDYIYVDDVIDAYLLAATNNSKEAGEVFNVGTGRQTSLAEIVQIAIEELAIKDLPNWGSMSNRIWDTNVWLADNQKLISNLRWKPRFSLSDGFKTTINWFKENLSLYSPQITNTYKI